MNLALENILLISSLFVLASIVASKSNLFRVPSLLLFSIVGMLAGTEQFIGVRFDNVRAAKFVGDIALILIIFSAGLDTRVSDVKKILWRGVLLSTVGVIVTATLVGFFSYAIMPISLLGALLLGSIISSTDATTIFAILRSPKNGMKGNLRQLLEFESGSNDAMAYFLTVFIIGIINGISINSSFPIHSIAFFLSQFVIGALVGIGMGFLIMRIANTIRLDFDGLYSVLHLASAVLTFAIANFFNGNGFLAVYLAAIFLGNSTFVHRRSITKHFDGQAWLMQIFVFAALGLLISPRDLLVYAPFSIAVFLFLNFIARPLIVCLLFIGSKFNFRSRIFVSWVSIKGSVSIVLAIYALHAGVPNSYPIFCIVSVVTILSVALQGTTIPLISKLLKLNTLVRLPRHSTFEPELISHVNSISVTVEITEENFCCGRSIVDADFPNGLTISLIENDGIYFVPDGQTIFEKGDRVTVIADSVETLQKFTSIMKTYK